MTFEFYSIENAGPEILEFPDEMVEIVEKMRSVFPEVKLEDINFRTYEGSTPILPSADKKSLTFTVPLAKTRVKREIGEDLYIVKITKYSKDYMDQYKTIPVVSLLKKLNESKK